MKLLPQLFVMAIFLCLQTGFSTVKGENVTGKQLKDLKKALKHLNGLLKRMAPNSKFVGTEGVDEVERQRISISERVIKMEEQKEIEVAEIAKLLENIGQMADTIAERAKGEIAGMDPYIRRVREEEGEAIEYYEIAYGRQLDTVRRCYQDDEKANNAKNVLRQICPTQFDATFEKFLEVSTLMMIFNYKNEQVEHFDHLYELSRNGIYQPRLWDEQANGRRERGPMDLVFKKNVQKVKNLKSQSGKAWKSCYGISMCECCTGYCAGEDTHYDRDMGQACACMAGFLSGWTFISAFFGTLGASAVHCVNCFRVSSVERKNAIIKPMMEAEKRIEIERERERSRAIRRIGDPSTSNQ